MIAVEMCLIIFYLMIQDDLTTFDIEVLFIRFSFFLLLVLVLNFSVGQSFRT